MTAEDNDMDKGTEFIAPPSMPDTEDRDRSALAGEVELNPGSLVGSYFHRVENDVIVWGGVVVGEVQPGYYLLAVTGLEGTLAKQRPQVILQIDRMTAKDEGYEFRFYDTEQNMNEAFAAFETTERSSV